MFPEVNLKDASIKILSSRFGSVKENSFQLVKWRDNKLGKKVIEEQRG